MLDLLIFLVTVWGATAAGRSLLRILRLSEDASFLERNLFGFALGLGLLAYAMLALGLLHGLYHGVGFLLIAALLAIGFSLHQPMALEFRNAFKSGLRLTPWGWGIALLSLGFVIIPLIGVWTPPTLTREWDSLSYHLADPKLYLQAHRIYYLPWESHSNFAFTAEMWYLFGLMDGGIPLSKLFHFACGIGACLATYAFGRRHLSPRIGILAALLFGSTPLVLWEAGTAYADLAPTFFGALTLLAVANGIAGRDERWLRLGAVLMGLTLSTKATSLTTLVLLAFGLLYWRIRVLKQAWPQAARALSIWCLAAILTGSPWFTKSTVYTGNPIYPFYSQIFGGRYWNVNLGKDYSASQANFGVGVSPEDAHSPAQAVSLPWNLTMYLLPGHVPPQRMAPPGQTPPPPLQPFNDFQWEMNALSPILLASLFLFAFRRGVPGTVQALGLYALFSLLLWFAAMQYVRYLLPLVPVLCLLAAWMLERAVSNRWLSGYVLAGLAICSFGFSLYTGFGLVKEEARVVFGHQSRDSYIEHNFAAYPATQYINSQLPPNAKVVFYGNPLGFYCNKPYLWGDAQHSTFIPYEHFQSADDLRAYLQKMGVTHILVNLRYFPVTPAASDYTRWVYALTEGSGPPVFEAHNVAVYALPGRKE